ncbi:MAG TPA: caspase family protein [Ktedonobacteraceae bacterium]|nr:caspase family protein [Ktedonobacteraceae bacterium]
MTKLSFAHGYALLIGVGNDLPVTVKDATVLHDLLIDPAHAGYPAAQVALLTEQKANRESILTAFDKLIQQVNNDPDATVVVYFSGHGGVFRSTAYSTEYFLVPYGYDPEYHENTAISDHEFTKSIEAIKARKLIVLLDCCHAGGMPLLKSAETTFEKSSVPSGLLQALQAGGGRVVVASSQDQEASYTGTPYSVFTTCLIEALSGKAALKKDGMARILEVLAYLFDQVPRRTEDKQHPFVNKMLNLDENFPLCYYAGGDKSVPGETTPGISIRSNLTVLTNGKRRRLETEQQQKQKIWGLYNEKIQRLYEALAVDTEPLTRFKHERELLQAQTDLQQLTDELDVIERLLQ